jgi:hypothetical protein
LAEGEDPDLLGARAEALRFSTADRKAVMRSAELASRWAGLSADGTATSTRILATREDPWRSAWALARARCESCGDAGDLDALNALGVWREGLTSEQLRPAPLVGAEELEAARIPRGPRWSELIAQAEVEQLDGTLTASGEVPLWLDKRAEDPGGSAGRQDPS